MVDGAVEGALEALHRLGEGHPGLHPALQQQQGGEVGDHFADARLVGMPIEQRYVEEKLRGFAPARQDQREGAAEHAGQGHAMLRRETLQAPALAGGKLEGEAPGARLADALRRAGQRQGRRVRQVRQAFQPVIAGPRRGLGALRRTARQVVGEMQRRRFRQAFRRDIGGAQLGEQQAQAFDIGGKQVEAQPEAVLAARHAHQPEQEHLAALHRQAFMGAPLAQRPPVVLGFVGLPRAPVLQVEARQRRRSEDLLQAVEKARAQHRMSLAHALRRRGQALRVEVASAEFEERVATDVAQHLVGAAPQPVGLLHGRQFEWPVMRQRRGHRGRNPERRRAGQQLEPGAQARSLRQLGEIHRQAACPHALLQVHQANRIEAATQQIVVVGQGAHVVERFAKQFGELLGQPVAQGGTGIGGQIHGGSLGQASEVGRQLLATIIKCDLISPEQERRPAML